MAKKLFYFVALLLYLIGTINGIGYSIYIGVAVLAVMAFPTAKKMFNYLFVRDI